MIDSKTLSPAINFSVWKCCAWAGPVYLLLTLVSWVFIAGFVPVRPESWTAQQIYQFYVDNGLWLRTGLVLTILAQPIYIVFSVAIWRVMKRVEDTEGILSMLQLLGAVTTWVIVWAGCTFWLGASFRPELRTPQEVMMLNDMGWLLIDVPFTVTALQFCAFGAAFLIDKRHLPLVPSWMCWLSFAAAAALIPLALIPFFSDGPFSWHGLIGFWLINVDFFGWIVPASYCIIQAVNRLEREARVQ